MSKRCELQKEYYQQHGNYKGDGKYSDKYVSWLEEHILALRIHYVSGSVCNDCWGSSWEIQFVKPCSKCKGTGKQTDR